jgi:hypothetical protein
VVENDRMTRTAGAEAADAVAAVRDDPVRRLALATAPYDRRAGRVGIRPYRRAAVAFMRWQIRRGVLAPPGARRPGSAWWRAVNERLIHDVCEADLLVGGRPGPPTSPSVEQWLRFLARPSPSAWYRAHNSSIVAGYLAHRDLSRDELRAERFFMDVALLRVLYAHCLVTAPRLALGPLAPASRILGDPRLRMADLFLSLRRILPARYPLDGLVLESLIQNEHRVGRMLDYAVIGPRLQALYVHSATELDEPRLLGLIRDGAPIYAWSFEDRHVWRTSGQPLIARLLARATEIR